MRRGKATFCICVSNETISIWKIQNAEEHCQSIYMNIRTGEGVEAVQRSANGLFHVKTANAEYRSRAVVLAMGRAGTPRKLGVKGEELPHVLYRLIEADHYTGQNILVVGGGDSAVEAAMGLAHQAGNRVTLSYRRGEFSRIKDRNAKRIATPGPGAFLIRVDHQGARTSSRHRKATRRRTSQSTMLQQRSRVSESMPT